MTASGTGKAGSQLAKAILAALTIASLMASLCLTATLLFANQRRQELRESVMIDGGAVRASLESGLNARVHMERGLVAFIKSNPSMNQAEFEAYSAALMTDDATIRNMSVLKGTVISFVYPYEQNQSALGRDLTEVPDQRESVYRAMETEHPILSGPLQLVQGGRGLVIRMSIYPQDEAGTKYYWGQASVVINADALEQFAGFDRYQHLRFALRHVMLDGSPGKVFWGDESLFDTDPVVYPVQVPGGSWLLGVLPKSGWQQRDPLVRLFFFLSAVTALIAGMIVFFLLFNRYRLRAMAYNDQLTQIPNRAFFWQALRATMALARREHRHVCLCLLDLDDFKQVNDQYGHSAGDTLLASVAQRLKAGLRSSDTVARLGGDEFAVIGLVSNAENCQTLVGKISSCFAGLFDLGGVVIPVHCSIGAALYPDDGDNADLLLAKADKAMYRDKAVKLRLQ